MIAVGISRGFLLLRNRNAGWMMTDKHSSVSQNTRTGQLSREDFHQQLVLFWEAAQPLKRILQELPSLGEGPSSKLNIRFPTKGLGPQPSIDGVIHASVESEMVTTFPNLPEDLFERLALRFRPFFAAKEATSFLKVLALMSRHWPDFKPWHRNYKARWNQAVFWGAMGMPERTPPVEADAVIEAGFYSRYFHVTQERRREAEEYEKSLGRDMFRVALVSSVWQRSQLVVGVADELEGILVRNGLLDEGTRQRALELHQQPEHIVLTLKGGPGAIAVTPFVQAPRSQSGV